MDPISLIVAAVAAGASAGLKEQAESAVKDAYGALKRMILDRHGVDVEPVETKPESKAKRDSLAEDLVDTGAGDDTDLVAAARLVIEEVRKHDAAAARAVGLDFDDVTAEFIEIADVVATSETNVLDMDRVHTRGGITVRGVRMDGGAPQERP